MATFYDFQRRFPDDEACLKHMMVTRFGGTKTECPKCGEHGKFYRMKRERAYECQHCRYQLHPTAGTFMHRTHVPLHKWFLAMFMFSTSRHGVAAKELERQLGVSYPTAWRMGHLIRKHMADMDGEWPLGGVVEADETLVGGVVKGKGRGLPRQQDHRLRHDRARRRPDGQRGARREAAHPGADHPRERRAGQHGPHGRAAVLPVAEPGRLRARDRQPRRRRICAGRRSRSTPSRDFGLV